MDNTYTESRTEAKGEKIAMEQAEKGRKLRADLTPAERKRFENTVRSTSAPPEQPASAAPHSVPYSSEAVDKATAASNRAGRHIGRGEAKLIHALLKGRR